MEHPEDGLNVVAANLVTDPADNLSQMSPLWCHSGCSNPCGERLKVQVCHFFVLAKGYKHRAKPERTHFQSSFISLLEREHLPTASTNIPPCAFTSGLMSQNNRCDKGKNVHNARPLNVKTGEGRHWRTAVKERDTFRDRDVGAQAGLLDFMFPDSFRCSSCWFLW